MARIKDILLDLENYEELTLEQQKQIRETHMLKKAEVEKILKIMHGIKEEA